MEIAKILIPVLAVLATAYLLLDRMLKNDESRRIFELRKQSHSVLTPIRLRAYERLVLFLERTAPDTMVLSIINSNAEMNCMQLHTKLLETVRQEYTHNIAQQIYVGDEVWEEVVLAKESLIKLINTCGASCQAHEPAQVLAERIIELYNNTEGTPNERAVEALKEEIRKTF